MRSKRGVKNPFGPMLTSANNQNVPSPRLTWNLTGGPFKGELSSRTPPPRRFHVKRVGANVKAKAQTEMLLACTRFSHDIPTFCPASYTCVSVPKLAPAQRTIIKFPLHSSWPRVFQVPSAPLSRTPGLAPGKISPWMLTSRRGSLPRFSRAADAMRVCLLLVQMPKE